MGNVSDNMCRGFQNAPALSNDFLKKIVSFLDNVEECGTAGQGTDDCNRHIRFKCCVTILFFFFWTVHFQ